MTSTPDHSITQEYKTVSKKSQFQIYKNCMCCTNHNENKPSKLIWMVFPPRKKDKQPKELICACDCRHNMRWMCRDCVEGEIPTGKYYDSDGYYDHERPGEMDR